MNSLKSVILLLAFVTVVFGANNTWTVVDLSTTSALNLVFWIPSGGNVSQGYQLTSSQVSNIAAGSGIYGSAFVKNFTFDWANNASSAQWSLSGDPNGKTYFTATITYPAGPAPSYFRLYVINITQTSQGYTYNSPKNPPTLQNSSSTQAFINDKNGFFVIKSASTSFSSLTPNVTATPSNLFVSSTTADNYASVLVDFTSYPPIVNNNTISSVKTFTAYAGIGTPPGGHIVLIIIICVAAGVVLSIIIFVVIYLRRRRNYERID
jgi:hypothetical protein